MITLIGTKSLTAAFPSQRRKARETAEHIFSQWLNIEPSRTTSRHLPKRGARFRGARDEVLKTGDSGRLHGTAVRYGVRLQMRVFEGQLSVWMVKASVLVLGGGAVEGGGLCGLL